MPDLRIEISDEPSQDIVHRFRNFGEDIYRAFRERYSVSLEEIDASTTHFHIREIRRRHLRSVTREILRMAAEHNFVVSASVVGE
jgi:hypothetical protein